jgi:hypothetical protein
MNWEPQIVFYLHAYTEPAPQSLHNLTPSHGLRDKPGHQVIESDRVTKISCPTAKLQRIQLHKILHPMHLLFVCFNPSQRQM